jgi:hypothetical protein
MATAYAQFTKNRYAAVKAAHPDAKGVGDVAKFIAAEWKELSEEQKKSYKNKIVRKTRKSKSPPKSASKSRKSTKSPRSSSSSSSSSAAGPSYDDEDLLAPVGFNRVSPSKSPKKSNSPTRKTKRKPNKYAEFMRNEGARIRRNNPEMSQVDVVREVGKRWKNQKGAE